MAKLTQYLNEPHFLLEIPYYTTEIL